MRSGKASREFNQCHFRGIACQVTVRFRNLDNAQQESAPKVPFRQSYASSSNTKVTNIFT